MAFLKQLQTIVNATLDSQYQGLQVDGILALVATFVFKELVHELEALRVLLSDEKNMHQPIWLFPGI